MLNDVLKEVPGLIGRRFIMNAFFPSFLFWGLVITVVLAEQADFINVLKEWNQLDTTLKFLQIIGFFSWVTFFSIILSSHFNTILRFYEGFWNFPLGRLLKNNRERWYQARLENLNKQDNYETIYLYYPLPTQPEKVMPTRLGNILRNAELYSFTRYEIDAVFMWPRLYNLLPERFIQTIAEAKGSLDFMLVVSALSGIFGLVIGVYLIIVQSSGWLFLTCFWGGLFLAWLAYQSALGSALLYAQQIKAGFDLYRNELLKQMRLELPKTPSEEIELWDKIRQFLYSNNTTVLLQYKDLDATKTQNSP
ncbi:hypothetical protein [Nostoc commune]|uniref:hypothetical protein n=1 Tax=Nostoc commune TaxID=1178 RepID=UPI0018C8472F|nr:hypothetical protein [Nostoc commune]MBG1260608.1 hypothetical protein [Nostoc commune BAE]